MTPLFDIFGQFLGLPAWLVPALVLAVPSVLNIVRTLREAGDTMSNEQKFTLAATMAGETLDSAFDAVPEWSDLDERQRDDIITGLVELALFIAKTTSRRDERKARRAARKERRHGQSS